MATVVWVASMTEGAWVGDLLISMARRARGDMRLLLLLMLLLLLLLLESLAGAVSTLSGCIRCDCDCDCDCDGRLR